MDLTFGFAAFVFYAAWCFVNGLVAGEKGRSVPAAALASIIATPLLVYLYLLAVPPKIEPTTVYLTPEQAAEMRSPR